MSQMKRDKNFYKYFHFTFDAKINFHLHSFILDYYWTTAWEHSSQ